MSINLWILPQSWHPNVLVFTPSQYKFSHMPHKRMMLFNDNNLCSRKHYKVIYDTHFQCLKSKHFCHFKWLPGAMSATAQYLKCGFEYKTCGYSSPALVVVLLITFSFVGATQGSVCCSSLHYCHVANVVAMVWALCHVLWISIIIHSLIWAEDITGL